MPGAADLHQGHGAGEADQAEDQEPARETAGELPQGGEPRSAGAEEQQAVRQLASRLDAERVLGLLERCLEADEQFDRRVQLVLVLEALLDAVGSRLKS